MIYDVTIDGKRHRVELQGALDHGPPADRRGGHGLDAGVPLGQEGLVLADEPPQLPCQGALAAPDVERPLAPVR